MNKETIESLIWKCFECELNSAEDFKPYKIEGRDITLRFFNIEDYENYNGMTDTFGWGILITNYERKWFDENGNAEDEPEEPEETMFYIYDYFDGTPATLLKNASEIVSDMAGDIMNYLTDVRKVHFLLLD